MCEDVATGAASLYSGAPGNTDCRNGWPWSGQRRCPAARLRQPATPSDHSKVRLACTVSKGWALPAVRLHFMRSREKLVVEKCPKVPIKCIAGIANHSSGAARSLMLTRATPAIRVQLLRAITHESLMRDWRETQWRMPMDPVASDQDTSSKLRAIAGRSAMWLLSVQARHLLDRAQSIESAIALRAADCLVSSVLKTKRLLSRGLISSSQLHPPPISMSLCAVIRTLYADAGCSEGKAVLERLTHGYKPNLIVADDVSASPDTGAILPKRDQCPVCGCGVDFFNDSGWHECLKGHRLQRCWVCLHVVFHSYWECASCGAAACKSGICMDLLPSPLCPSSRRDVCGLCGSSCSWPSISG